MKLLSIDPSLVNSGWALFRHGELIGVGHVQTKVMPLAERLSLLQERVSGLIARVELCSGDTLICEDATTMKDPSAALKIEQVRGIFECTARFAGASVPGRINPRTVHTMVLGMRGSQLAREIVKAAAAEVVRHLYGAALKELNFLTTAANLKRYQDICDAILVGHVGLLQMEEARRMQVSFPEYFELRSQRHKK
jgi:Holliday junction resolvasome RuvABC endonuclease subunit